MKSKMLRPRMRCLKKRRSSQTLQPSRDPRWDRYHRSSSSKRCPYSLKRWRMTHWNSRRKNNRRNRRKERFPTSIRGFVRACTRKTDLTASRRSSSKTSTRCYLARSNARNKASSSLICLRKTHCPASTGPRSSPAWPGWRRTTTESFRFTCRLQNRRWWRSQTSKCERHSTTLALSAM